MRCNIPESKCSKSTKTWFLDILECIGCIRGKNSLLPINTDIATRGCDVRYRNQKVQKAPKNDFWTYWSILGAFMAKTHLATRAAKFCQLMPICDVIYRNQNVQKAPKHDFWTYWSVFGAFVAKTHFATRAATFCQLMPTWRHVGALFYTGIKKFKKHLNKIFGHIGVYWVRSWQNLTS